MLKHLPVNFNNVAGRLFYHKNPVKSLKQLSKGFKCVESFIFEDPHIFKPLLQIAKSPNNLSKIGIIVESEQDVKILTSKHFLNIVNPARFTIGFNDRFYHNNKDLIASLKNNNYGTKMYYVSELNTDNNKYDNVDELSVVIFEKTFKKTKIALDKVESKFGTGATLRFLLIDDDGLRHFDYAVTRGFRNFDAERLTENPVHTILIEPILVWCRMNNIDNNINL